MHAVILAIIEALSAGKSLQGASVYTTLFPGHVDAQMVVECGIKEVVYRDNIVLLIPHSLCLYACTCYKVDIVCLFLDTPPPPPPPPPTLFMTDILSIHHCLVVNTCM